MATARHGLREAKDGAPADVLLGSFQRNRYEIGDRRDSFLGVSVAVGSEIPTGDLCIGEVWAAMPDLVAPMPQMPETPEAESWRRPLVADPRPPLPTQPKAGELLFTVAGLPDGLDSMGVEAEISHYALSSPVGVLARPRLTGMGQPFSPFEPQTIVTPSGPFVAPEGAG